MRNLGTGNPLGDHILVRWPISTRMERPSSSLISAPLLSPENPEFLSAIIMVFVSFIFIRKKVNRFYFVNYFRFFECLVGSRIWDVF